MAFDPKKVYDIAQFNCDVIINSLGVDTTDYGAICKSILGASTNKKELEDIIKRANDVYDVGEYFFTESYGLPVEAICHLITPHHDNDDKNLNVLIYSLKNVLMSCKELGYRSIGIPLVGTGANKYDPQEVYGLLVRMCSAFCDCFKSMSVTIVVPDSAMVDENEARLTNEYFRRGGDYHYFETKKKFKHSTNLFKNYYQYDDRIIEFNKGFFNKKPEVFSFKGKLDVASIKTVPAYINRFIEAKFDGKAHIKAKKNVYCYLGYGKKNPISSGTNTFKKMDNSADKATLFKLCFATRMNEDEASGFIQFFGYSFAQEGVNKTDDTVRKLLKEHIFGIVEINKRFERNGLHVLFK